MAERRRWTSARQPLELDGLRDLDDLEQRLNETHEREQKARVDEVEAVTQAPWSYNAEEDRHGLRVLTAGQGDGQGQIVRASDEAIYVSLFRDVTAQPLPTTAPAE